eukprot:scaffold24539_cov101-Isochrysis_galbana.AAC.1
MVVKAPRRCGVSGTNVRLKANAKRNENRRRGRILERGLGISRRFTRHGKVGHSALAISFRRRRLDRAEPDVARGDGERGADVQHGGGLQPGVRVTVEIEPESF